MLGMLHPETGSDFGAVNFERRQRHYAEENAVGSGAWPLMENVQDVGAYGASFGV